MLRVVLSTAFGRTGTISLTLSTTRQINISLYLTDNRRVRGLNGSRSISRKARRSTTEQIEPRRLITPVTQEATCGTEVASWVTGVINLRGSICSVVERV